MFTHINPLKLAKFQEASKPSNPRDTALPSIKKRRRRKEEEKRKKKEKKNYHIAICISSENIWTEISLLVTKEK